MVIKNSQKSQGKATKNLPWDFYSWSLLSPLSYSIGFMKNPREKQTNTNKIIKYIFLNNSSYFAVIVIYEQPNLF